MIRTTRVEAFSDGVFAIALTLLVLTIEVPDVNGNLGHELARLWPAYGAYGLSVLVIGAIWVNHHAMFDQIDAVTWPLLFLNTTALGLVAFLPLPTEVLAKSLTAGHNERVATFFYGVPFALFGFVTVATWAYTRRHGLIRDEISDQQARRTELRYLVGPTIYATGAALGLLVPALALALYAFLVAFFWYPTRDRGDAQTADARAM